MKAFCLLFVCITLNVWARTDHHGCYPPTGDPACHRRFFENDPLSAPTSEGGQPAQDPTPAAPDATPSNAASAPTPEDGQSSVVAGDSVDSNDPNLSEEEKARKLEEDKKKYDQVMKTASRVFPGFGGSGSRRQKQKQEPQPQSEQPTATADAPAAPSSSKTTEDTPSPPASSSSQSSTPSSSEAPSSSPATVASPSTTSAALPLPPPSHRRQSLPNRATYVPPQRQRPKNFDDSTTQFILHLRKPYFYGD